MGCVDLSDRMANNCSISKRTWKCIKKFIFHLLYLTIMNSYVLYKSWGGGVMTQLKFSEQVVRDLVLSHEENNEIVVCQGVGPSDGDPNELT
jgi:hypothetical protein